MNTATDRTEITTTGDDEPTPKPTPPTARTLSLRWSTVVIAAALAVLLAGVVTFGSLYWSARSSIADRDAHAAAEQRAEKIATDYAVGASTIDYRDVRSWFVRLKSGTSPQLGAKFDATSPQLEQILLPLQWTSRATPLSATVISESGGIYTVNAYLDVTSTSAQTPDGTHATVTYSVVVDSNAEWKITDVGGMQEALPAR
jgi:Mce-associated membrane protein